jgi:uncharacterized protein (DUF362 family)
VNTNPLLVGAAAGAFLALGAKTVVVAEGPGHQRDTYLVLAQSGFASQLQDRKLSFVDLNRDDVRQVKVTTPFTVLDSLWVPQTILAADVIVFMPKVKTHHWAGVALRLKNMFGTIPGSVYGWPKNVLHWKGIDRSILDLNSTLPAHFVIADGIVAMEGNGPLHGTARDLGRIVMSDDPVAADFTCARLMGFDPYRISHLAQAAEFLGNGDVERIDQRGEIAAGCASVCGVARVCTFDCGGNVMTSPQVVPAGTPSRVCRTRKAADSFHYGLFWK